MKRSTIAVLLVVCVGGVAALVALFLRLLPEVCTAEDDRLAASLATLDILDAHPVNATPQGERGSGCYDDGRIVTVSQFYRFSGPVADVLSFYRDAATMDGWKPPREGDGERVSCFVKSIDGRDVGFSAWVVEEDGRYGDEYQVDVTSSMTGSGGWC
ncbi:MULTISPECIES: hypothetical protein [unclassified Streptosporangium]|uniref:hypothetical protein n=1 Tax=unclassified Streptosporangium TaxID=2632669 RepID=UPI002E2AC9D2|nr:MULTISPECIES: hypothetical protein [unclassified Streptosporangium]